MFYCSRLIHHVTEHLYGQARFCQTAVVCVCVCFHPQELGLTGCCHGYSVLTPQELCRLVEDIINNKGLEAKVTRGSGWGTSSHSYYNWQPFFVSLSLCVCVGMCVCLCSLTRTDSTGKVPGKQRRKQNSHTLLLHLSSWQAICSKYVFLVGGQKPVGAVDVFCDVIHLALQYLSGSPGAYILKTFSKHKWHHWRCI